MPQVLTFQDTETLGRLLGCDPAELRHEARPARAPNPGARHPPARRVPLVTVPEIAVGESAAARTIAEAYSAPQSASRRLPEPFLRYEGDAMAPELQPGDRIVVDTSRRWPTLGDLFVLWDGNAIVIKRFERVHDSEPPTIRLHSDACFHPPYTCLAS